MKSVPCNCCKNWEEFDNKHNDGEWTDNGYQEYLNTLAELGKHEKTVRIRVDNIIDESLLRTLKIIGKSDVVDSYHIDGQDLIRLTIKFKKWGTAKEEDVTSKKYG